MGGLVGETGSPRRSGCISPIGMAPQQLELHQIKRPYSDMRITRSGSDAQLLASIEQQGQSTPVLVCSAREATNPAQYVLIDGYRRVRALERLGRDTALATKTELSEQEALLWHHQMESRGRRSALEEAWLLYELEQCYNFSRRDLAKKLSHSESWISRRIALVEILPERVQQLVRQGALCAYSAQKYLVPLARANPHDCEVLASGIAERRLSTRAVKQLYIAWRKGTAEQKQRVIHNPHLFVAAMQARERDPRTTDDIQKAAITGSYYLESDTQLTVALDHVTALLGCICRGLERRDAMVARGPALQRACSRARSGIATAALLLQEAGNAGQ